MIYRGLPAGLRHRRARIALEAVGLTGWEGHTPAELSGGQQQRVAIARALVTEPKIILADEPTGNLDSARSREIMSLLTALNRERAITIIMVTHEAEMAAYAGRRIHFVDGVIEAVVLSTFGGLAGILIGLATAAIGAHLLEVPFILNSGIIAIAFLFSAAVGVLFGYFPARQAARLDPIDALRYE